MGADFFPEGGKNTSKGDSLETCHGPSGNFVRKEAFPYVYPSKFVVPPKMALGEGILFFPLQGRGRGGEGGGTNQIIIGGN